LEGVRILRIKWELLTGDDGCGVESEERCCNRQ